MNKTVYKEDLDLGTIQLEEVYPGKAYVRHGGRQWRFVHHKNGTETAKSSIVWKEETVIRVWLECIVNTDEIDVRQTYELHILMDGGELLDINLTAKQYARLAEYKYTKPAIDLVTRILKKDGKGLLIKKVPAVKIYTVRAHRKVSDMIGGNSKKCGLSESEYIERCCAGISPRLALNDEEKAILKEFAKGRQDFQFFFNMLSVWREGKSREQIADAVIMGEKFLPLRKRLAAIMQDWDKILGKLLNRQIEDK